MLNMCLLLLVKYFQIFKACLTKINFIFYYAGVLPVSFNRLLLMVEKAQ